MRSYLLLLVFLTTTLVAQKRFIVSPTDEFIPMAKGANFADAVRKAQQRTSAQSVCGNKFIFGYPKSQLSNAYGAKHKDVMAEWFVSKAGGTVDSIFFEPWWPVGAYDSSAFIRILRSNIVPGKGPGSGPYRAPCTPWGYYINANDSDRGITPFRDEATDTNWVSTAIGDSSSFDPLGDILWGHSGVKVRLRGNDPYADVVAVSIPDLDGPLHVNKGDAFFVTIRINSLNRHPSPPDDWTYFFGQQNHASPGNPEEYPSRFWKFYEHESTASQCGGVSMAAAPKGWFARGGFSQDSLDVANFYLWYQLTVTENVPPDVESVTQLHTTFETSARIVDADVLDCDPEVPSRAGVKLARIGWSLNGVSQSDIPMSNIGGLTWTGMLPGEGVGSEVTYHVYAEDSTGLSVTGSPFTYRVVSQRSPYALAETTSSCTTMSIAGNTGNVIPPENFYLPPGSPQSASALNDGTAGPFDMGSNMPLFSDFGRYIWIGINGGVAISKSAADTVDVNANGLFSSSWTFPNSGPLRHGGRSDPSGKLRMPGNFFAPLWEDLWGGDSVNGTVCGHVRFQRGFGTDTCVVIVEWDSIGAFSPFYSSTCDELTFRAIFNKCDGTITYQYDNVGTLAQDTTGLVGLQADSTALTVPSTCHDAPYLFVNQDGYPEATRPSSGSCVTIYQSPVTARSAGWNLISLSTIPAGNDHTRSNLYPEAISPAFSYRGIYLQDSTLVPGRGYWIKYPFGNCGGEPGKLFQEIVDTIRTGWNLIGTISFPVPTSSITQGGGVNISSGFYEYDGFYNRTTTLNPGYGYWVKASSPGTLTISGGVPAADFKVKGGTDLSSMNSFTITDREGRAQVLYLGSNDLVREPLSYYELPPAMPGFDARFASGGMVETYEAHPAATASPRYSIHVEAESYPLRVSWNIVDGQEKRFILCSAGGSIPARILNGTGSMEVTDAKVQDLLIGLENHSMPRVTALHQNFPNPFNPSTNFSFEIATPGLVTLKIFDVLGREVTTLVNEEREPGSYTVAWQAENYASGIYFYELTAGQFSDVKKLVVVK